LGSSGGSTFISRAASRYRNPIGKNPVNTNTKTSSVRIQKWDKLNVCANPAQTPKIHPFLDL
jgi:hypothetical protein